MASAATADGMATVMMKSAPVLGPSSSSISAGDALSSVPIGTPFTGGMRPTHVTKAFREALTFAQGDGGYLRTPAIQRLELALHEGFLRTDEALVSMCRERGIDYSACTAVTAVVSGDLLTVAHLGDSKVVLGRDTTVAPAAPGPSRPPVVIGGKYLTTDHKPDMVEERRRIESCGGSLAYLHGGKPFIRGGDFSARQALGDRPMQLNYSRAFGGKDLKRYGLSATPDILQIQLTKADRLLILASDGLWDVATADSASRRAWDAHVAGRDPAEDLVDYALAQHDLRGSVDNVTVIVVFFQ